jgi:hypothetical protein
VIPWACSIALFPFWCLDAKGGEVALLGCLRWDLHGVVIWICTSFSFALVETQLHGRSCCVSSILVLNRLNVCGMLCV